MRFPSPLSTVLTQPQQRSIVIVLALMGVVLPVAGFHKFYLRQPWWGAVYLLLSWTPIPHVAAAIEAVWYLLQSENQQLVQLPTMLTPGAINVIAPANPVNNAVEGIRQLEQLRVDGLVTEYEFEQKRRQLLDQI
jgi:TM2 domain-containing membrane protein YozV